jgi:hypothetical protein
MFKSESDSNSSLCSDESMKDQDDNEDNDVLPTDIKLITENDGAQTDRKLITEN